MEISFVIQGGYWEGLKQVLGTIRKFYPNSETIVVCNNNIDPVIGQLADKLIQVDDPGALPNDNLRNLNRQIVTTKAGIEQASNPYVCKMRNDLVFTGKTDFESYTRKEITFANWYSVDPRGQYHLPYHPSDWLWFGTKSKIQEFANVPLCPLDFMEGERQRFRPEQYYCTKYINATLKYDVEGGHEEATERCFADRFDILELLQNSIMSLKYNLLLQGNGLISRNMLMEWERKYA